MFSVRFRNNLRFAFRKEIAHLRGNIPLNRLEFIGNYLSWFVYEFRQVASKLIRDPRFVTVVFTSFVMTLTALIFYPSFTWSCMRNAGTWVGHHLNWEYIRFGLWLLSEVTILGLGMRAFGRFSNQELVKYYATPVLQ